MLFRLILGLALGYLAYRVIRRIKEAFNLGLGQTPQAPKVPEPDVLVQDPVCRTFIPRQEALKLTKDGQEYFFCSEGCLKRFQRGGGKTIQQ
jgi:YHS domain-containing protein